MPATDMWWGEPAPAADRACLKEYEQVVYRGKGYKVHCMRRGKAGTSTGAKSPALGEVLEVQP